MRLLNSLLLASSCLLSSLSAAAALESDGEISLSNSSYLQMLGLSLTEVRWGSFRNKVLNSIILSSKRPVTDKPASKVRLMTAYDIRSDQSIAQREYQECFDVFVFTLSDPNAPSKIGVEIQLIKDMTPSSATIEGLKQKLTDEFTIMAQLSEKTGWQLNASTIAHAIWPQP